MKKAAKSESHHCFGKPKVILKDELLEIRNVDGSLHIARKVKHPDELNPPKVYDPYRPGDEFTDD